MDKSLADEISFLLMRFLLYRGHSRPDAEALSAEFLDFKFPIDIVPSKGNIPSHFIFSKTAREILDAAQRPPAS